MVSRQKTPLGVNLPFFFGAAITSVIFCAGNYRVVLQSHGLGQGLDSRSQPCSALCAVHVIVMSRQPWHLGWVLGEFPHRAQLRLCV